MIKDMFIEPTSDGFIGEGNHSLKPFSVKLKEIDGILTLIVEGNMNIISNCKQIESAITNSKYKFIPSHLIPFIEKYNGYIGDVNKDDNEMYVDLYLNNKVVTAYFKKYHNKGKFICRYDTSEDNLEEILKEYDNISEKEIKKLINSKKKMNRELKKLGYEFQYSHSQEEFVWCWSDIEFDILEFSEEEFLFVSKTILKHADDIKKVWSSS